MVSVKVDDDKCIGCGFCASICAEAFEIGSDGKSHVKDVKACKKCDCKAAAEGCPVQAIEYKE
jgi:ferredoxin